MICTGKTKAKVKLSLIETKLCQVIKSDKNLNNRIVNHDHHKYKWDTLLNLEYIMEIKNYATFSGKGTELDGKSKENNKDISIILNDE